MLELRWEKKNDIMDWAEKNLSMRYYDVWEGPQYLQICHVSGRDYRFPMPQVISCRSVLGWIKEHDTGLLDLVHRDMEYIRQYERREPTPKDVWNSYRSTVRYIEFDSKFPVPPF